MASLIELENMTSLVECYEFYFIQFEDLIRKSHGMISKYVSLSPEKYEMKSL